LSSGGVDCWGYGYRGELGDGRYYTKGHGSSAVPVQVAGVGSVGALSGAATLSSNGEEGYCAVLISGGVDCWGWGYYGELGDGRTYVSGPEGSANPVEVKS
jgi:alpha-tubulin suppressor-like RCC1 family protein